MIMVSLVEPCKGLEVWGERWNWGMNNGEIFGENREVLLNNWMGWGWKMATLSTLSPFKDNPHKIARSPEFRVIPLVHLPHLFYFSALFLCYSTTAFWSQWPYTNVWPTFHPTGFLCSDLIFVIFSNVLLGSIFLHMKALKLRQKFPKFLQMWRNFQFPHNCHTWKAEISLRDIFCYTNIIRDIRDKY